MRILLRLLLAATLAVIIVGGGALGAGRLAQRPLRPLTQDALAASRPAARVAPAAATLHPATATPLPRPPATSAAPRLGVAPTNTPKAATVAGIGAPAVRAAAPAATSALPTRPVPTVRPTLGITLDQAGAAPEQVAPGSAARCVILTYHYIKASEPFASQLRTLHDAGYDIVPLERLVRYLQGAPGATLPGRCLVVTLDDGWRTQFTFARPALLAAHVPATFFIITNYADQNYSGYMTWPMVETLAREGFDVEDHTRSHPRLDLVGRRSLAALRDEIDGSLADLEAHVGPTKRIFNYPYGTFDNQVLQVVREQYVAAVQLAGSAIQRPDDRYMLRRVMVEADWPPARVLAMIHLLEAAADRPQR